MALTKSDIPDLLLPGLKAEFAIAYKTELDASTTEKIATVINTTMPAVVNCPPRNAGRESGRSTPCSPRPSGMRATD